MGPAHFILGRVLSQQSKLEAARDEYRLAVLHDTLLSSRRRRLPCARLPKSMSGCRPSEPGLTGKAHPPQTGEVSALGFYEAHTA